MGKEKGTWSIFKGLNENKARKQEYKDLRENYLSDLQTRVDKQGRWIELNLCLDTETPSNEGLEPLNLIKIQKHHLNKFKTTLETPP